MQIVTNMLLSNAILATLLAAVVFGVTRIYKNHFAAHLLWLLVLIKLMSPPLVGVPQPSLEWKNTQASKEDSSPLSMRPSVDSSSIESSAIESPSAVEPPRLVESNLGMQVEPSIERRPVIDDQEQKVDRPVRLGTVTPLNVFVAIWVIGSVLWCFVAGWRLVKFARLLKKHALSDEQIQGTARSVAARIGLRRCPQIVLTPAKVPPFVWAPWKPIVVLPRDLVKQLDQDQIETLLAHELIHLRRGDHWIRRYEMILSAFFWWHPVFWLAVKELHIAEEQCCDAAVVQDFPKQTYKYSEVLLKAAEFVCPSLPATAIPIGQGGQLIGRVRMVLHQGFSHRLSSTSLVAMGTIALMLLPLSVPGMEAPFIARQSLAVANESSNATSRVNRESSEDPAETARSPLSSFIQGDTGDRKDDEELMNELARAGSHYLEADSGFITSVFFMQPTVSGELLRRLQGFPELEEISLESTSIAVDDLVHLKNVKGLKSIHLTDKQFNSESLVHLQAIANLRALYLRGDSIDFDTCQLLKQLPNLEELRLFGVNLSDDELKIFQELPKLSAIMIFGARTNPSDKDQARITDAGLLNLACIKNLTSLHLGRENAISDTGMEHLKDLIQLEQLQITSDAITDLGLSHLQGLVNLKVLRISEEVMPNTPGRVSKRVIQFTDEGLKFLGNLTRLQDLHIQNGKFSDGGIIHLAALKSLKSIFLSNAKVTASGLKHLQALESLESLNLEGTYFDDNAIEQLSRLANLKHVNVNQSTIMRQDFKSLKSLNFISVIMLNHSNIGDEDLKRLSGLKSLNQLDLSGTFVTDDGLEHIASLPNLMQLSLADTDVSDAAMVHLQKLRSLTNLDLRQTRISDDLLIRLAVLPNLSKLSLGSEGITTDGLKHLSSMKRLEQLSLSGSPLVTDEVVQNLRGLKLRSLELGGVYPQITDKGAAFMSEITTLRQLDLSGRWFSDNGMKDLATLPFLMSLQLSETDITDAGLAHLASMPELRFLTISRARITDDCVQHLARISGLEYLLLERTQITEAGIKQLRKLHPNCNISWLE